MENATEQEITVNLHDTIGEWESTIHDNKIAFVKMDYDTSPEDPTKSESANGTIYSFSRRHSNFIGNDKEAMIEDLLKNKEAVRLSYFEHGQSLWMVAEAPTPPGVEFQWDGVRFAGLWVPDKEVFANIEFDGPVTGEERRTKLLAYAAGVVEQFSDWCNGNVYGYKIEVYPLKKDEDGIVIDEIEHYQENVQAIECDSCCGFYGFADFEEEVRQTVRDNLTD